MRRSQDPDSEEEDVEDTNQPVEDQEPPTALDELDLQGLAMVGGNAVNRMQNGFGMALRSAGVVTSAFRVLVERLAAMDTPAGRHVLYAPEGGAWTVHHPLACRQPNWWALASCEAPKAIAAAGPLPAGWHLFVVDAEGLPVFAALTAQAVPSC
jgi:hypothetical protein